MEKLKKWFKDYKKESIAVLIVITVVGSLYINKQYKMGNDMFGLNTVVAEKVAPVQKQLIVPHAQPKCTPTEVNYVLQNNDKLLAKKNWLVIDLDTFNKTKEVVKYGKHYSYYQRFGKEDLFITIAKKVSKDSNLTK